MDVMKGEERRKQVRIYLPDGEVRISSGMIFALAGKVVDISIGGIKLICSADFEPESVIDLEVTLPTGTKFKCLARIIYKEQSKDLKKESIYGAEFVDLGKDEKARLGEFIMEIRRKQDDMLQNKLNFEGH